MRGGTIARVENLKRIDDERPKFSLPVDPDSTAKESLDHGVVFLQHQPGSGARFSHQVNLVFLFENKTRLDALDRTPCEKQGEGQNGSVAALSPDGGGDKIRTCDPLRAKQMLSQLSYAPINFRVGGGLGQT